MKNLKYFIQYILIVSLLFLFKLIGHRYSLIISSKIIFFLGPLFRSNELVNKNLNIAFPNLNNFEKKKITREMWSNYGRILAEYIFIKNFRNSSLKKI